MDSLAKIFSKNTGNDSSLIVYKEGLGYLINNQKDEQVNIRSISKTIIALACGILIDENKKFNEETYIYPIIKNKIVLANKSNEKYLRQIKVKHLLTHTVGYRDILLMSKDISKYNLDNLLNELINYPIYHKPGTHFLYSNASYYLLAAAMEEFIGYDLFDFIEDKLFNPLGIEGAKASKYGDYLAGATKFYLSAEDLFKIAKLLINNGKFDGRQVISQGWIKKMKIPYFKNNPETKKNYLSEDYYGYSLWLSENKVIFASGTGGQLIVLLEELGTIIVTTNNSASQAYKIKDEVDKIIQALNRG